MKLSVATCGMADRDGEDCDGNTARTQAYIMSVEDTSATQGGDEEDEDADLYTRQAFGSQPTRRVRKGRRAA